MKTLLLIALLVTGCATGLRQRGGHARHVSANYTNEFFQPENPAMPSTQTIERTTERDAATANVRGPVTRTTEKISTTIGASHVDHSAKLKAGFASLRPVQFAGIALVIGAAALCYFQWWTKAAIVGGVGVGMIILAAVIPGHEGIILATGAAVAVIGCLLVLYVYHKGKLDEVKK